MNAIVGKPYSKPPERLSRKDLVALGQLEPLRFCVALCFDVAIIAASVAASEFYYFSIAAYIAAVILIGSRLHALGVLMHECVHYRAFKTRKLNMFVAELIAWPILTTAEGYRNNHLSHHRHLNTNEDPDWVRKISQRAFHFPKTSSGLIGLAFYQLSGIGIVKLFLSLRAGKEINQISNKTRRMRLAFYLAVGAIAVATGLLEKLALYWAIPMLSTFPFFLHIRSVSEHHGNLAYDHVYTNSRTTLANAAERFFFMPHNVGFHLEHHLYPHVPFYRLTALHGLLMQEKEFAARANITRGVCTGLIRELKTSGRGPIATGADEKELDSGREPLRLA